MSAAPAATHTVPAGLITHCTAIIRGHQNATSAAITPALPMPASAWYRSPLMDCWGTLTPVL